jgi:hypothetical protein
MARVVDGVVAVDVEHTAGDVTNEFLETAWLPSLSNATGEQAVPGEQLGGGPVSGWPQCQRHRAGGVAAKVDDVEGEVADGDDG